MQNIPYTHGWPLRNMVHLLLKMTCLINLPFHARFWEAFFSCLLRKWTFQRHSVLAWNRKTFNIPVFYASSISRSTISSQETYSLSISYLILDMIWKKKMEPYSSLFSSTILTLLHVILPWRYPICSAR